MNLLDRRNQIAARHKVLVGVSGSSWHKDDPQERARLARGAVPICDKPIALQDDDLVHVVGTCADAVRKALATYKAPDTHPAQEAHAAKIIARLPEAGDICLGTQEWMAVARALRTVGVDCVLADANNIPAEEK